MLNPFLSLLHVSKRNPLFSFCLVGNWLVLVYRNPNPFSSFSLLPFYVYTLRNPCFKTHISLYINPFLFLLVSNRSIRISLFSVYTYLPFSIFLSLCIPVYVLSLYLYVSQSPFVSYMYLYSPFRTLYYSFRSVWVSFRFCMYVLLSSLFISLCFSVYMCFSVCLYCSFLYPNP